MFDEQAHFAVITDENVPTEVINDLGFVVNPEFFNVQRINIPAMGPQASIEMAVLTAVAIYFLKPYVDGFLNEAGRSHYRALRKSLKKLRGTFFGEEREFRVTVYTSSGERIPKYSLAFSLYVYGPAGLRIKLIFPHECSVEEYNASIDAFLDLIEQLDWKKATETQEDLEENSTTIGGTLYVKYDADVKALRIVDPFRPKNQKHET